MALNPTSLRPIGLPHRAVRFNPAEPDVFATTGSDRGIALYDLRSNTPIRKLVMQVGCDFGCCFVGGGSGRLCNLRNDSLVCKLAMWVQPWVCQR